MSKLAGHNAGVRRVLLLAFLYPLTDWAQCGTCIGNCLNSSQTGAWTNCNTWAGGGFCTLWTTFQMNTRYPIINSGHTVTLSGTIPTNLQNCLSIYIRSGGTLTLQSPYTGNTSGSYVIDVCGTLNISLTGTADFKNFDLIIHSGGVVNINSGTLRVNSILVENGGVLNLNGGRLERACLSSATPALRIDNGGLMNINSGSGGLSLHSCLGSTYTLLDGTIDCKNSLTSSNYSNFQLGYVRVTNGTSTGRIRTQTAYVPGAEWSRSASNNFWGFNSDYGGTVEYYGSSSIFLALNSRYEYYDLEVNCPVLYLYTTTDVVGVLYLRGGDLDLNGKTFRLRGTARYTGSYSLRGSSSSRLEVVGKFPSPISPALSTYQISSQGGTVSCRNLPLRFSADYRSLKTLWLYREDAVFLETPLDIYDTLNLETGILRTSTTNLLTVRNTASGAVLHHTTGWFSVYYGFVSGPLRRYVGTSGAYDFPVGYPNLSSYYVGWDPLQPQALHRRLRLEISAQSGINWIQVEFVPGVSDVCSGQLNITEADGTPHLQLHPEGYWRVQPDAAAYTVAYDVKAYTWGFAAPPLADNRYAVVKRPDGSTACADWTRAAGTWLPAGSLGRVIKVDGGGRDTSYAHRLGWDSFSEFAIGITDVPLASLPALSLILKHWQGQYAVLMPKGLAEGEPLRLLSGKRELSYLWQAGELWVKVEEPLWVWIEAGGQRSTPLYLVPPPVSCVGERVEIRTGAWVEVWGFDGRLVGRYQGPGSFPLPAQPVLLRWEGGVQPLYP
ncbi:MAG: hypothetical protein KatS3mg025_0538 [Bacteroidia bacterium]|nr:MAG: hypothetical protein KatS3mg025_0538 [Bacteroidia bacterium]